MDLSRIQTFENNRRENMIAILLYDNESPLVANWENDKFNMCSI